MTDDIFRNAEIDSQERFRALLRVLVEEALIGDVDVRGTWEFATRGSEHNWEVEIIELDKAFDDADIQPTDHE